MIYLNTAKNNLLLKLKIKVERNPENYFECLSSVFEA